LASLLTITDNGLYCEAGDFYIDPWRGVDRAVITHAHSDHARWGSKKYLASSEGAGLLRARLGNIDLQTADYGERVAIDGINVSLHPAGHVLGSAQVRVEHRGEVWVVTGDYKTEIDSTCTPFELVRCNTFITECTFGLPIYRWPAPADVFAEINGWWRKNQSAGRASVLFAYALGKAQRLLAGVDRSIGPIYGHGSVIRLNEVYRETGIDLPDVQYATSQRHTDVDWSRALIIAPTSAAGSTWLRRFGPISTAFASGWMTIRGRRRQRTVDRGFIVSDHVDWPALNDVIDATGASCVWPTHGYTDTVARWLRERGLDARPVETRFSGEVDEPDVANGDTPEADDAA
jgi:putative mRNA 3-end processing factor